MKIRYFDHAATTYVKEEVLREMFPYYTINYGNASSIYSIGRISNKAVDDARSKVAKAINANKKEIYFTSCGSESDNLALKGILYANTKEKNHIITSKIEHPAILDTCKSLEKQGYQVTYLNVNKEGFINLEELENSITDKTILISIMFANNEIGTIQPIEQIGKIAKTHQVLFHTDAVQAVGNIKIDVKKSNIDLLSMSAHKFYGPKGMGALYVRKGIEFEKIQNGGHQENDKRAGTENIAGIVGIGKAIELADNCIEGYNEKLLNLREYFRQEIIKKIPYTKINGSVENRLSGNLNVSFEFIDGNTLLTNLDKKGICTSTGSACSSGDNKPSHVLLAIGLEQKYIEGALRVTFGCENTKEDVEYLINSLEEVVERLRKMNPYYIEFIKNKN